mmetsp:Transcript_2951/g.3283  ORF Transcript_2951/g.3283 Transcript_2951/m.3283 type:complete len:163 (-) Transcript_2951:67-555(-)
MPTTKIDYSVAHNILNKKSPNEDSLIDNDDIISTPYGLSILEIQGELNLPQSFPQPNENHKSEYLENFVRVNDVYEAVKFGRLEFDPKNQSNVTLYIGKSQRLLGSMVDLETPLAVLRIKTDTTDNKDTEDGALEVNRDDSIKIVDIVRKKIIFKQRPLPIM